MSEVWTKATICFESTEATQQWADAFSFAKEDWAAARDAFLQLGVNCVKTTSDAGISVSSLTHIERRLEVTFMELAIETKELLDEMIALGATHMNASSDDSRTGSVTKLICIGKEKAKEADFIAAVSEFDDHFAFVKAIQKGKTANVKKLLAKGISPDTLISSNVYPIHLAVANGKKPIVKLLVAAGANVNVQTGRAAYNFKSFRTPLHLAIFDEKPDIEIITMLVNAKADLTIKNGEGATPLYLAIQNRHPEVCQILMAAGADPDSRNANGVPALLNLSTATEETIPEFLAFVKKIGFDMDMYHEKTGNLRWQLGYVRSSLEYLDSLGLKPRPPEDAYTGDLSKDLYTAISHHHLEKIDQLIADGVDVNALPAHEESWHTPKPQIIEAAYRGYLMIVKKLLAAGANLNATNANGETVLQTAASKGHLDIVQFLIEQGVDANTVLIKEKIFSTLEYDAMTFALDNGHFSVAEYLLPFWKPNLALVKQAIIHTDYLAERNNADHPSASMLKKLKQIEMLLK